MDADTMSIAELAVAAGMSRRAIRFYVHRGLISPPHGRGRGCHYDHGHLEQLKRVRDLQLAGHSLDAIKRIQDGQAVETREALPPGRRNARPRASLQAALWTRLEMADGVELHLDASRFNPDVTELLAIQQFIREILGAEKAKVASESHTGGRQEKRDL